MMTNDGSIWEPWRNGLQRGGASAQAGIGACHQYVPHYGAAAGVVTTSCHGSRVQTRILIS